MNQMIERLMERELLIPVESEEINGMNPTVHFYLKCSEWGLKESCEFLIMRFWEIKEQ